MKKTISMMACALLLFAACSDTDDEVLSYADDAQAMHFAVDVARATRADGSTLLDAETTVYISEGGSNYYPYTVYDEAGNLKPTTTSFLRWKNSNTTEKEIYAAVPSSSATSFTVPPDQSSDELLTAADYMTFVGTVVRPTNAYNTADIEADDPNAVTFRLTRRLSRVNVTITPSVSGDFTDCTFDMTIYSLGSDVSVSYADSYDLTADSYRSKSATVSPQNSYNLLEIKPNGGQDMKFAVAGEAESANSATAIVVPTTSSSSNSRFIAIQRKKNGVNDGTPMYLMGIPTLAAGKTYDFTLTIENDAISINSVVVNDWATADQMTGEKDMANLWCTIDLDEYETTADVDAAIEAAAADYSKIHFKGAMKADMDYSYFRYCNSNTETEPSYTISTIDLRNVTGEATEIMAAYAFQNSLAEEIYLPQSLKEIGGNAFNSCKNLTSATIPASVNFIEEHAYLNCSSLTSFTVEDSETALQIGTSGNDLFNSGSIQKLYIGRNFTFPGQYGPFDSNGSLKSVVFSEYVTAIPAWSFYNDYNMTSVTMPSHLESIGTAAFNRCQSLQSIIIPSGVTSLEEYTFEYCYALKEVAFPGTLESIAKNCFYNCYQLTTAILPNSLKTIGESAFSSCNSLNDIGSPTGLEYIGNWAFNRCSSLSELCISGPSLAITLKAFYGCSGIKTATLSGVAELGRTCFNDCTGLTSVIISGTVTDVGESSFCGCTSLQSITLPTTIKRLVYNCFERCPLTSFVFSGELESIGAYVFRNCTELTTVDIIGNNLKFSDDVFTNCPKLTSVTLRGTVNEFEQSKVFSDCATLETINMDNATIIPKSDE